MVFCRYALCALCCLLLMQQPASAAQPSAGRTFIVDMAFAPGPVGGRQNQLYCIDLLAGCLYRIDPESGGATLCADNLTTPHGLAVHQSAAYVCEMRAGRLVRLDLLTGEKTVIAEGLKKPTRVAVKAAGDAVEALYVTQLLAGSVVRLTPGDGDGPWRQEVAAGHLLLPDGIAVEPGGETALVCSFFAPGAVTRIDLATGRILGRLTAGLLWLPAQFAVPVTAGQESSFFISEMLGQRITRVSCDAGGTCLPAQRFGPIRSPSGLALSQDEDRLFAVESFSGRIIEIDIATGAATTIALLPGSAGGWWIAAPPH